MNSIRRSSDAGTVVATFVAMIPGFVFPFLLTLRTSSHDSDSLLLAMSIMTTLNSVMGSAVELNTVSEFGRQLSDHSRPAPLSVGSYARRIQLFGFGAVGFVAALLTTVYSVSMTGWSPAFVGLCALMAVAPIAAIYSSMNAGILIAAGNAVAPIASQGLRPALPILLLLFLPTAELVFFALGFGVGEIARWILLSYLRQRTLKPRVPEIEERLETNGMIWQASSAAVGQGGPSIERVFLASAPAGSVSAYELANKILFAAVQFLNYGFLVRRVGHWSRIPKLSKEEGTRLLQRDILTLLGIATVASLLAILSLFLVSLLPIPEIWVLSARWAMILLLTAPLSMWISTSSRLIIIARKQRYLLWFSLLTVASTLLFSLIFFLSIGPFGIILATVCSRTLSSIAYAVVFKRVLRSISESSGCVGID